MGGWQNYDLLLSRRIRGCCSDLTQSLIRVSKGQEYLLKLQVSGRTVRVWVDGRLCAGTEDKPVMTEPLYYGASRDEADQTVILKVVNLQEQGVSAHIIMKGMCGSRLQGTVYTMQADLAAENDFAEPERVAPQEAVFYKENDSFMYEFPKFSLTVFRLKEI